MQMNIPNQQQMNSYTPSYGSYPYNPVQRFQQQDPQFQNIQAQPQNYGIHPGINGKMVLSVENITANDVPMDGTVAFFPKQDLSEIYAKQWAANGTINTVVYKPYIEGDNTQTTNSIGESKNSKIDLSEESIELFMKKFDEVFKKIEELESKIVKSSTSQRKSSTSKRSVSENETD